MSKVDGKAKILIVSANPETTRPLRLDQEKRDIEEALMYSPQRDSFTIEILNATRISDLRRIFVDPQRTPNVLHFCGHGSGAKGLVFEDNDGKAKYIQGDDLANFLSLFTDTLECVVLNACYSEVQAKEIQKYVNCVIGMEEAIGDKSAIAFSVAFYEALFAGRSYKFAYDYANKALKLDGDLSKLKPVLLLHDNVTPCPTEIQKKEIRSKKKGSPSTISMEQHGSHSVQIASISGGTTNFTFGKNSEKIVEENT